jgi:hypothetical protein
MPDVPLHVSAQARGLVRQLRQRLHADARAIAAAAERIPDDVIAAAAFKGKAGADRAWSRILAAMPSPPFRLDRDHHARLWRFLQPVEAVLDTPDGRNRGDEAVVLSWLCLGLGRGRAVRRVGPWGLSVTDHALARLLERTAYRAEPVAAILEAHDMLLDASSNTANALLAARQWAIPAGPGALLCTVRSLSDDGDADALVLLTAETWVSGDQLRPQQVAQVAAIRFREGGRTLGDGLLLPAVLRPAARPQVDAAGQFARLAL